jgi:5'(3')-deoxyribonucleotidase
VLREKELVACYKIYIKFPVVKSIEMDKSVYNWGGWEDERPTARWCGVSFCSDKNILELIIVVDSQL